MARELILKLSHDVGQLLVAGAHLAPSSTDLAHDRDALARLAKQVGAKAPAIVKLAEAADKTTRAGAGVATELLGLMQMAAQVRAAQAQPAPVTADARPLSACPPLGTRCNARDLDDLYTALVEKGQGRMEVIERHIESGAIIDLRLVEALVFAMGDPWIGEKVTEDAIPKLGRAIVAPIRARLDLKKGRGVDGRRLRALVAIEKEDALPLLEQAVSEGSAEIREAAMDAIADHVSGRPEFEKHALAAIRNDRSSGVQRAAMRALAGSSSDEALELLLEAFEKSSTRHAAAEALASSRHPEASRRMLARLRDLVAAAVPRKVKARADAKEKEKAKIEAAEKQSAARELLIALTPHKLPELAGLALELLHDYGASAARAVLESGDAAQLRRIADTLTGDEEELYPAAAQASFRLPDAYKRLTPLFKGKDTRKKLSQVEAVMRAFRDEDVSEEWRKFLVGSIKDGGHVAELVIPLLGRVKEQRALQPLMRIVKEGKGEVVREALSALAELGDPAALDVVLGALRADEHSHWIYSAVLKLADASTVDKVRTLYAGRKDPNHYTTLFIRNLLQVLEARFPGR